MNNRLFNKIDAIDDLLEAYNRLIDIDQESDNKPWSKVELIAALNNAIEYYNDKEEE